MVKVDHQQEIYDAVLAQLRLLGSRPGITGAFLIMGFAIVVQLLTLPVEIDASFKKALPVLSSGYLTPRQLPAARSILRAAAFTYVAASFASLLNFWRWLALLRR